LERIDDRCRKFSQDVIKEILDAMASMKMNVFIGILADDQGWRIELKNHPKLNKADGLVYSRGNQKYC
jgi:hexosaminidase